MRGKSVEYFKLEDYIIRVEAVVVILKVFGFDKKVIQLIIQIDYFDDDSIFVWVKDVVKVLKDEKIMVGIEDNNFLLQQWFIKGSAVNFVYNFINFLRDMFVRRYFDMSFFSLD